MSFICAQYQGSKRGWSPFRRYTYFVSSELSNKTFINQIGRCDFSSIEAILQAFSIEAVNKEFYKDIASLFTKLTGGWRKIGSKKQEEKGCMELPGTKDETVKKEFAVRLIGRLIFCWFLKKKQSNAKIPLIPEEILSTKAMSEITGVGGYYHSVLEPLFFELLNTQSDNRKKDYKREPWSQIPFLNGGLFTPHEGDYYELANTGLSNHLNTLIIPDEWLRELLAIFERYNFTIDENTPIDIELSIEPEMLGRIFENLLAEINPETGETARKATGSYYTPRTIVEYMVDESLKQYLLTKTCIDEKKISSLLSYADEDRTKLTEIQKESIIQALDEVRILDPACGSGAFPMGILQKILLILQKLDPDSKKWMQIKLNRIKDSFARKEYKKKLESETGEYIHKLGVIQNSIYGVDIQPIAAEISKLRVFLSLVVDQKIYDSRDNRGIEPLPNLKYKFVYGNSLIDKFMGRTIKINEAVQTKSKVIIDQLTNLKADFFSAISEEEKVEYNLKILQGKIELAEQLLADLRDTSQFADNLFGSKAQTKKQKEKKEKFIVKKLQAELLNKATENARQEISNLTKKSEVKLADVEHIENRHFEESFIWKLEFAEIFSENNGFDIVIANPPYVGEKGHKEIFREIKQGTLGKFYRGKMDIFYFFFHLAINLSGQNSQIAFITTDYYPTAYGALKLRKDFKEHTIVRKLIDFNELKVFESALGQHNMITILTKATDKTAIAKNCVIKRTGVATSDVLHNILDWNDEQTLYYSVKQNNLYDGDEFYIRLNGRSSEKEDPIHKILEKVSIQSTLLEQITNINSGADITISKITKKHVENFDGNFDLNDGVFVLSKGELKTLHLSEKERKVIKPFIKNSNINKYFVNLSDQKLIYLRWENSIGNYPNIKKHLERYREILEDQANRYEETYPWYALHRPRKQEIFEAKEKILVPYRNVKNVFGYSINPIYSSRDVFFITNKFKGFSLKYILTLLNSKLYYLWLYHKGKRKGKILELYQKPLSEIPVKTVTRKEQQPFIDSVDEILNITKTDDYSINQSKQAKVIELEKQIDQMVYRLYCLTDEEIAIVENSVKV